MHVAYSYWTVNGTSSSCNGASDSGPKQAGNLVVLLVPVSAETPVSHSLPGTTREMKLEKINKIIASFFQKANKVN